MPIEYHVIPKTLPQSARESKLYYPILKRKGTIGTEDLSEAISKRCTLHPADVQAVVIALSHEIRMSLESGQAVRLDQLGTFSLSASCSGSAQAKQVRSSNIKKVRLHFHPDARIKRWLSRLEFYKTKNLKPAQGVRTKASGKQD